MEEVKDSFSSSFQEEGRFCNNARFMEAETEGVSRVYVLDSTSILKLQRQKNDNTSILGKSGLSVAISNRRRKDDKRPRPNHDRNPKARTFAAHHGQYYYYCVE